MILILRYKILVEEAPAWRVQVPEPMYPMVLFDTLWAKFWMRVFNELKIRAYWTF